MPETFEVPPADSENAQGQTEWALRTELRVAVAQIDEITARSSQLYDLCVAKDDEIKWLRATITALSVRVYKK